MTHEAFTEFISEDAQKRFGYNTRLAAQKVIEDLGNCNCKFCVGMLTEIYNVMIDASDKIQIENNS